DPQRQRLDAVAMFVDMIGDRIIRPDGSSQEQGQLVLPNRVARPIFYSRFRPGIRQALKPKRGLVKMRRLLGIPDVKLDVISALEWQKIFFRCRRIFRFLSFPFWNSNCRWHNDLLTL